MTTITPAATPVPAATSEVVKPTDGKSKELNLDDICGVQTESSICRRYGDIRFRFKFKFRFENYTKYLLFSFPSTKHNKLNITNKTTN